MNAPLKDHPTPPYKHSPLFPLGKDTTPYRKISSEGLRVEKVMGEEVLVVPREALRALAEAAFTDIAHLLRPAHLASLKSIVEDPEASNNDKFVAFDFLKNANIAAGGVLPMCQDTGTALVMGKKGRLVWTDGSDEGGARRGRARRLSQAQPALFAARADLDVRGEEHQKQHAGAGRDFRRRPRSGASRLCGVYKFLFIAKGGGSANKAFLFQATPSILTRERMLAFLKEKVLTLGTAACPPYHLAIVIGGTSAELTMKTVKLASTKYYDTLPDHGSEDGHAFRDKEMEQEILKMTQSLGVGAQFGGKYFCHDVRVIRLPRHGASLPIGLGVSCSADRQAIGKITKDGVFLEELEHNPAKYLPEVDTSKLGGEVVKIDLNKPMKEILAQLAQISDQDAAVAHRPDDRRARYRACETARAAGEGRGPAGLFQEPSGVLRRAGEDAGRLCVRRVRADHRGPHGFFRRRFPGRRRLDGDAGEGQPLAGGARGLQEIWRLLSRLDRRRRGKPRRALHQESRDWNIPNSAWKRSGGSRWSISRPSSSSTTRATTSSRN